jgi:methylenetetrahydrofolate reductase (NADPH)
MRGSTELEDLSSMKERSFRLSAFAALLRSSEFIVTAELNPPKSASAAVVRRRAEALRGFVDAVNVTDSNRAMVAMAAIPAAVIVGQSGVEPIVQMTGRDRNRIALQADVLGAAALGLETFVFMSGDDPRQGSHPDAMNVKDLDGIGLVRMAAALREGRLLSGDELKAPPNLVIGATASPFTAPMEADLTKAFEKIAAGAEFLQTQPVFEIETFTRWVAALEAGAPRDVPILAGVLALRSAAQTERLAGVPGLAIGGDVIERMRRADDGEREGITIAVEQVRALRKLRGVRGVHLYAIEWPDAVGRVVERAGLLPRPEVKVAV